MAIKKTGSEYKEITPIQTINSELTNQAYCNSCGNILSIELTNSSDQIITCNKCNKIIIKDK